MLSRTENRVMSVILDECKGKDSFLISPVDFLQLLCVKGMTHLELEKVLEGLCQDGYLDLVYSDRHGERVYCIALLQKGRGYKRNGEQIKRNLIYKLAVTVVFAVLSFVIGIILKAIF